MSEKYIDTVRAAALLGVHRVSVSAAAKEGRIPGAVRLGSQGRGLWQIPLQPDGSIAVLRTRKPGAGRKAAA